MLKEDWKQNLVLVMFCVLLFEVLTGATLGFVALGLCLVFFNIRANKTVRNILAIGVFASYWMKYGKIIDPEIGLNFLTSIIVLKILEKETVRDRYMIFFGLLLLISAGSLFERTLTYVFFFGASFLVLITDFYSYLGQKWRLKDLGLALVWVAPLTFFLFFLVPRLLNPIPFQQNSLQPGEIGYTPDVNISQIESLEGNTSPVFQVIASKPLAQGELYWRGNTLSFTDGWNWKDMVQDREGAQILLGTKTNPEEIKQNFRLFTRAEYFFTLDRPRTITYGKEFFGLVGMTKTMPQRRWDWVQRYDVNSDPKSVLLDKAPMAHYLKVPLSKKEKEEIRNKFSGKSASEVVSVMKSHFLSEKFFYSLSPGRSETFKEFMQKKIGFCSHYASATAIILRINGIPSRLVSGFMGGTYNKFADFYLVSQNDAHVWVEFYVDGKWNRIDPTEWIAPDRVMLGGEAFMASGAFSKNSLFKVPAFFNDVKLWFAQWDFLFYQWLEQMDYHTQEAWMSRLHFKRAWLFTIIPLMMVFFMLMYTWYLSMRKNKESYSIHQDLWRLYFKKMKKRGLTLSPVNLYANSDFIKNLNDEEALGVFYELILVSFQDKKIPVKEIRKRIKRL